MGLAKVALNFMVKNGKGELVRSVLRHTRPPGMPINIKGLKYNPLNLDTVQLTKNSTVEKLLNMGVNESDAKLLAKTMPEQELLKECNINKQYDCLDAFVEETLDRYNNLCAIYGRNLNFGKKNPLNYITTDDIGKFEVMDITKKHRAIRDFTRGHLKSIPNDLVMTEQDKNIKSIIDRHFKDIKGTEFESLLYRGEVLERDLPYVQRLESIKEGDIFDIPGYAWVTDSEKYGFRAYAGTDVGTDFMKIFNRMRIKHYILCPKNTKLKASRPREGQEFVMPCDSKMKLIKKEINEANREIILYSEHIPF